MTHVFPPPPRDPLGGQAVVTPWMKFFTAIQTASNTNLSFTELAFILQTADALAPNAQALSALVTGYLKNTTGTGVLTVQAVPIPVADGGTHLASGTDGGILGYTAAGVLASSVLLTNHAIVLGRGAGATPVPLASLGTSTTVLHGAAAGDPTFGAVSLTADVSGDLPFANLAQGSALSVLGVTGNATADVASIAAGADANVLRRSGTAVAFGSVNLAASGAVGTSKLGLANAGTNADLSATGGTNQVLKQSSSGAAITVGTLAASNLSDAATIPAVKASGRVTAQTAAVASVSTFTVGAADASYLVWGNVLVTTATAHSFSMTCAYTDESNTARTLTLNFSQLAGTFIQTITNITGAGPYEGVSVGIRCKAATAITFATTGTFTTVTYNAEGVALQLST